eukprot:g12735.t1
MRDFEPRALGILAMAMMKSDQENGTVFAAISHRSLELYESGAIFNSLDICQLLVALAHFRYRDELLLKVLASRLEESFEGYDSKARDIAMWSFSILGGVPGGKERYPHLVECLLEPKLRFWPL